MRRSTPFLLIAATIALACRPAPPAPSASGGAAAEREQAKRQAPADVPIVRERGDRHARAAARRSHVVKRIRGRLARCDERAVVIRGPDATPLTLRVVPSTSVTLDGRPARAGAIPPGAEVRAAYRTGDGGRPTAISIEARGAADGSGEGRQDEPPPSPWEPSAEPGPFGGG